VHDERGAAGGQQALLVARKHDVVQAADGSAQGEIKGGAGGQRLAQRAL
jgi:hypothetical protein